MLVWTNVGHCVQVAPDVEQRDLPLFVEVHPAAASRRQLRKRARSGELHLTFANEVVCHGVLACWLALVFESVRPMRSAISNPRLPGAMRTRSVNGSCSNASNQPRSNASGMIRFFSSSVVNGWLSYPMMYGYDRCGAIGMRSTQKINPPTSPCTITSCIARVCP